MISLVLLLFFLFLLVGIYLYLYNSITTSVPSTFPTEQNRKHINHNQKVLVCFGDSNTHGNVSYDWVATLAAELPNFYLVNAGRNSDLTYTLLERIENVIACKPDYINLLIGTNDVTATTSTEQLARYRKQKRIDANTTPSIESFEASYIQIITQLQARTNAKIALMSLPPMSEDLNHSANQKAEQYSQIIKKLAEKYNLQYLPLREMQKEYLAKNISQPRYAFEKTYTAVTISILYNRFLGWDWDKITTYMGNQLSPDNLHQNSIAGTMIKDLVKDFCQK